MSLKWDVVLVSVTPGMIVWSVLMTTIGSVLIRFVIPSKPFLTSLKIRSTIFLNSHRMQTKFHQKGYFDKM